MSPASTTSFTCSIRVAFINTAHWYCLASASFTASSVVADVLEIRLVNQLLFTNAEQMSENHDVQHGHVELSPSHTLVGWPDEFLSSAGSQFDQSKFLEAGKVKHKRIGCGLLLPFRRLHQKVKSRELVSMPHEGYSSTTKYSFIRRSSAAASNSLRL